MKNPKASAIALVFSIAGTAAFADMSITFEWGDIPLCTSGRPNTVSNPDFTIRNIPDGADQLQFRLVDLDVPTFNHGGGRVRLAEGSSDVSVAPGAFRYSSPCPPNGSHSYQWTVTAKSGRQTLGTATATRDYPE